MNVTLCPEQLVDPMLLVIETEVTAVGFTVMFILLLFAEELVTQLNEDVSVHVMISPLFNDEEV